MSHSVFSALNGYPPAQDVQTVVTATASSRWRDVFDELGDRRVVFGTRDSESYLAGGVLREYSGTLSELPQFQAEMTPYSVYFVMMPFPRQADILNYSLRVWAPKSVIRLGPLSRSDHSPRVDEPGRDEFDISEWSRRVALGKASVAKVVLSRTTQFSAVSDPIAIADTVFSSENMGFKILHETGPDSGFFSVSPERLFRISNGILNAEAIAGTESIDHLERLLTSQKDLHEHRYVRDWLVSQLEGIGLSPSISATELLRLTRIGHLRTQLSAKMTDVTLTELIGALFPTPAVSGFPRDESVALINELEPNRGSYSGIIGIVTPEFIEFVVLIRFCAWDHSGFLVRVGAGIVAESDPLKEWEELNQKLRSFGVVP